MMVEDKVSGTGLIQTLRREGIPIVPVQRNKDKLSRGYDAAPFIESGNVLLPRTRPGCPTSWPRRHPSPAARTTTSWTRCSTRSPTCRLRRHRARRQRPSQSRWRRRSGAGRMLGT
jgi:hypothetical protein